MDFIPFSAIKPLLSLDGDTYDDYPDLIPIVEAVKGSIEDYLGRVLDVGDYTQTVLPRLTPTRMIYLEALPVNSVASVEIDGTALTEEDYVITDYGLRLNLAVVEQTVAVEYNGGLSTIPSNLSGAAAIQAAYEYQSKSHIGAQTITTDGGTVTRPALQLLPEVKRRLAKLRHPKELLA